MGYNPGAVRSATLPLRVDPGPSRSKRLLALAGDERLVAHVRRGSEAAFEVVYERYGAGILGFCRHMLGSQEEAEDAVQHTFASAYSDLLRDEREIRLKPWLYTIARNRCLSILRARHEQVSAEADIQVAGLEQQVEQRTELRELLRDLGDLPENQRAALLLSEAGGLAHAEIAGVLGCEVPKVKALVFRARSGLMQRREARELPCAEVREQLANLRGGSLRRSHLRHHMRECQGCREFRAEVKRQRALMAAVLPVTPSLGLKGSVLSAAGLGGGTGGGGAALGGGTGLAGALSAGAGTAAKVAVVGALVAGGGVVAEHTVLDGSKNVDSSGSPAAPAPRAQSTTGGGQGGEAAVPGRHSHGEAARAAARRRALSARAAHPHAGTHGRSQQAHRGGQSTTHRPQSITGSLQRGQRPDSPPAKSRSQSQPSTTAPGRPTEPPAGGPVESGATGDRSVPAY
jgi:RNA polymerase sigma factor (sigma-70 family)